MIVSHATPVIAFVRIGALVLLERIGLIPVSERASGWGQLGYAVIGNVSLRLGLASLDCGRDAGHHREFRLYRAMDHHSSQAHLMGRQDFFHYAACHSRCLGD